VKASPLARRVAAKLGIDLATLTGTGPGGVIEQQDVERAAKPEAARLETEHAVPAAPSVAPSPKPAAPVAGMRRAIAAAMARSNREIPHYYLETRIDMRAPLRWLEETNRQFPIQQRILPAALLLKAAATALGRVPELNGYWVNDALETKPGIHIGVAISLRQGGLVIPAIHDVNLKSVPEVMAAMSDLIQRARGGRLRSSELTDGTITITNLGDLGVETVWGVIYPPQVALIGLGRIREQPWAENGLLGVRPVLHATLAADHRATDGHRGAQFLEAFNRALQEPDKL
jgi:pyruvate dehydrogenase E2 component (dihydrolipoamide acetyltransferase)